MKGSLRARLDKLEPTHKQAEHHEICRELWREIADDRARYNELEVELTSKLEPETVRLLGSQGENAARRAGWLIVAIIEEHHLHGYPLALPTALLRAFLDRSDDFCSNMNLHACSGCGYGMPYRCRQTGVRDFHAVLEYDFLLTTCPLCIVPLEPGKTFTQRHGGYPNGKSYSEVPPLILYPFENSRIAGTRPSDFGVTMPGGWEA